MGGGFLVFCEQRSGRLKPSGLQALARAIDLAGRSGSVDVVAVLGKDESGAAIDQVARLGPDKILVAGPGEARMSDPGVWVEVLERLVERLKPSAVLLGATAMGKDLAATLAARLQGALIQDCLELDVAPAGGLVARREVYGGRLHEIVRARPPALPVVTLRRTRLDTPELDDPPPVTATDGPPVEALDGDPLQESERVAVREFLAHCTDRPELSEAEIVVAGGRGLGDPSGFAHLEELADLLRAAIGASRAVVDDGWRSRGCQIGLTGKVVSPKLYIACGISGAVQHRAGITAARIIVAINSDPQAPIFKMATYGIVGDASKILPLLVGELRKLKEAGEL